ncbi:MAG: helix-turn-helix domain-containing protein [Woeseiaceae bacterium]
MQQTGQLIDQLKRALKSAGVTYADLATHMDLSEASIKRLFQTHNFSLARLEQAANLAGLDISDLVERMNASEDRISELTPAQEQEFMRDPKLLLMIYMLINQWSFNEIVETFEIEPGEGFKILRRLEKLGMIEILPFNKVKLRTARNFGWRRNGPVQAFFREQVQAEFFASQFLEPEAELRFVGARMSRASLLHMHQSFAKVIREFDDLAAKDASLPRDELVGAAAVLAVRPWEFSLFSNLRRDQSRRVSDDA